MTAYYFSHRIPVSFSAQDVLLWMWVRALTWKKHVAAKATPPYAEVGSGEHHEIHWVVQVWGKWLLCPLQLQSLVPRFPESKTHLMHPSCIGVSCLVQIAHAGSLSGCTDRHWTLLIKTDQQLGAGSGLDTEENKTPQNTDYLFTEYLRATRTLMEKRSFRKWTYNKAN